MKKYEVDFMYLILRMRFDAYEENMDLFKVLIRIVHDYEKYFTKKYKGSKVEILGEDGLENTLVSIHGYKVLGNNRGFLQPNTQLYYDIEDDTGKTTNYHYSWIEFK